ncbi:MAG: hypothetical protein J5J06_20310 [Phycisphaerae bacterium]|nr:hypothetical protein [Phycisphaerae bacterium]
MKLLTVCMLVSLLTAPPELAPYRARQSPPTEAKEEEPAGGPVWFCTNQNINKPDVWREEKVRCEFEVRNNGDAPLEINTRPG